MNCLSNASNNDKRCTIFAWSHEISDTIPIATHTHTHTQALTEKNLFAKLAFWFWRPAVSLSIHNKDKRIQFVNLISKTHFVQIATFNLAIQPIVLPNGIWFFALSTNDLRL